MIALAMLCRMGSFGANYELTLIHSQLNKGVVPLETQILANLFLAPHLACAFQTDTKTFFVVSSV